MLVLTRKKGESIMLGNEIELTVLEIDGEQIKLGINAPKHVEVHRKEIYLAIQDENKEAANQQASVEALRQLFSTKNDI